VPIELTIALNVGGWLVIQLGLAWAFTKMPVEYFNPGPPHTWEHGGRFYERVFSIKRWKDYLPDAARWFSGGFAKGEVTGKGATYWQRFVRETWRGELCHWCAIACAPVFFLWNPWWGDVIIVAYAVAANLPCILAQRYNRCRLARLISRSMPAKTS
jgi:glycosyl-4,4'-diaponeurosporenoate acyltransferase